MPTVRLRRPTSIALAAALMAASVLVVSVSAGNTRHVFVGSGTDGDLPTGITISAGEIIPFVLTLKNEGRQTLNNVRLVLGQDGDTTDEANPQRDYVPTQPISLPTGVTVTASPADASTAGCDAGGSLLTCTIGTLTARQTLNISVTIVTTASTPAAIPLPLKAVVTVAEIGNDNGANTDTFAAEGSIDVLAFSCESVAAYRTGPNKTVSTCAIEDGNPQSASVTIPSRLTQVTLSEGVGPVCPPGLICYGEAVSASILDDLPTDVIRWTVQVNLTENLLAKPNLQQLTVLHVNDENQQTLISLAKKNACKAATSVNCGNAFLTTADDGDSILNIYVQTKGNGGIRAW